jgi:hypothetical protein
MRRKILAAALFALFAVQRPFCLTLEEIVIDGGLILIGATDSQAAPTPLLPMIGASVTIGLPGNFFLEPGLDLFGLYYFNTGDRVVPTELETAGGFYTQAVLISLKGGLRYPISDVLQAGGTAGLDFLLRFPLEDDQGAGMDYFFGNLRFLYPELGGFLKWQAVDSIGLVFSLRTFIPIFHLWDGEGLPFTDQFMVSLTVGLAIKLGKAPGETIPEADVESGEKAPEEPQAGGGAR